MARVCVCVYQSKAPKTTYGLRHQFTHLSVNTAVSISLSSETVETVQNTIVVKRRLLGVKFICVDCSLDRHCAPSKAA